MEELELNDRERDTSVHDLVSICRRCSRTVPLAMHCAFARDDKECYLHGTEEQWRAEIKKGGAEEKAALRLNCYSSGAIKLPLAAQVAEGIGATLLCLRTLLGGFWVTRISHDQDAHIGKIYRRYFKSRECYDRAHIAVSVHDCRVLMWRPLSKVQTKHTIYNIRTHFLPPPSLRLTACCIYRAHFVLSCPLQKNFRKNVARFAKGSGDRAVRNFANASRRGRELWIEGGGKKNSKTGEHVWAEAFIEFFHHLAFHMQGQFRVACASVMVQRGYRNIHREGLLSVS